VGRRVEREFGLGWGLLGRACGLDSCQIIFDLRLENSNPLKDVNLDAQHGHNLQQTEMIPIDWSRSQ